MSLDGHLVAMLSERVRTLLESRDPGHCLQVSHIPADLADRACADVHRTLTAPDLARVVVASTSKPWQATASKVVELRNLVEEEGGRFALFVPAGRNLAAEDSFGRSTFEVLETDDLYDQVRLQLGRELEALAPDIAERADEIVTELNAGGNPDLYGEAAYLARLLETPSEEELGRGLVEMGLLPDRGIAEEGSEDLRPRLERNRQQVDVLTGQAPPADRVKQVAAAVDPDDAPEVTEALMGALADGSYDAHQIARRLERDSASVDLSPIVAPSGERPVVHELSVLSLTGDFAKGSDPPTIKKTKASVRVKVRCRPAPKSLIGLKELRLELMQVGDQGRELAPAGVEAVKRSSLPKNPEFTWSQRLDIGGLDSDGLGAGLYRLRVTAIDEDNLTLGEDFSDTFRIHEDVEESDDDARPAMSIAAARVACVCDDPEDRGPGTAILSASDEETGPRIGLSVRFSDASGRARLDLSRLLARVERFVLDDPGSLVRYTVSLDEGEIVNTKPATTEAELPSAFIEARAALFEGVVRQQYEVEGAEVGPLTALADLVALESQVEAYVREWAAALESAERGVARDLLRIDQVEFEEPELVRSVLVGPTHPLRIAWLWRYQKTLAQWERADDRSVIEAEEILGLLPGLMPSNIPHVLATDHAELRYLEPLDLHWGLWSSPSEPDATGLAGSVRERLGLPRTNPGVVDVTQIVLRIRRYLAAHPYVDLLKINFVQPGLGDIVLDTLLALQGTPISADLRYEIRLFATDRFPVSDLGRALDDFMADPEAVKGVKRDAADAFLSSSDDPLSPKLIYSKHGVEDLLNAPARFPAHITVFVDWFDLDAVPVAPLADRRSFFAGGLIVDPVIVYRPGNGDLNPQWDEHVATPTNPDWFAAAYATCERATSALLGPPAAGSVPAVRLELDRVRRSILDAVHERSDWVIVLDPVFADEYLDSPVEADDSPRYLIDSTDPGALETNRRIMVSTRSRAELERLFEPVLDSYELPLEQRKITVLLDGLQALNAGLPLKLLNNRTQAAEAFGLALATTYLAGQGILRRALIVPLDMHAELFRERPFGDAGETDLRRTDLAVIQVEPDQRRLAVHLVEVKARAGLPEQTPEALIDDIAGQLQNSERVLRTRLFSRELRENRDSLAGALMVRRLTRLLGRYVDRAGRYGFMDPERVSATRRFIAHLDQSFSVSFERHGLIFDLGGPSRAPEAFEDVSIVRIGREQIIDLLERTQTPVGTKVSEAEVEDLRTVLGASSGASVEELPEAAVHEDGDAPEQAEVKEVEANATNVEEPERPDPMVEGPDPADVWIAGSTPKCRQFGVIGRVAAHDVAFDVDGTNVVSVFGVQGSGKSYTVGNLIEAALIRNPALNRLPRPLAGVVFHYSTDETYLPEFVEMFKPNERRDEVDVLRSEYGTAPGGVTDVRVLVPGDLVEDRAADFPGLEVSPLKLGADELLADDWRLLMGVAGGDQLYVKALTNIFRSLRRDMSVRSLRKAIKQSQLNSQQQGLANQRLDFVEAFVEDGAGLASLVAPGRLLVVDVRDPYMEEEEVLSLFMVLLRLFSQAGDRSTGEGFNKLIVFDEAHKYMENPRLTGAIVETVREMRHKGTSVVIASQNPPSVPREVIELSSVIVAHRFTAPTWLEHIRKVNDAFGRDLKPARLAKLEPGEAFLWSGGGADELKRPQRVRMRPRLSMHGGATRRATGE